MPCPSGTFALVLLGAAGAFADGAGAGAGACAGVVVVVVVGGVSSATDGFGLRFRFPRGSGTPPASTTFNRSRARVSS